MPLFILARNSPPVTTASVIRPSSVASKIFMLALPIGFLTLLPLLQGYFMRNFLYNFLSWDTLGSYSTAYRLTIFYTLPSLAITNAILPFLIREKNKLNFTILANKFLFFTLISMTFCLTILTLYSKDLFHFILK